MDRFYSTPAWRTVREFVLRRDGKRCTVARLIGGACDGTLHVHHIVGRKDRPDLALDPDNLGTACALHHAKWDAIRRALLRQRGWKFCTHRHVNAEARKICERRLNRDLIAA